MSHLLLEQPAVLPFDRTLQDYLTSSEFLSGDFWKIVFSPCSQYLAIPKQDEDGRHWLLVLRSLNWHTSQISEKLPIQHQFHCSSPIRSLAFGRRQSRRSALEKALMIDGNLILYSSTSRDLMNRRRSSVSVNRRHDFTKNLFLAAGLQEGKINIWNIDTGELTLTLKDHQSAVCGLDITSCTMQLASCSDDTTIKLWNLLDDGNMYKTLQEWTHQIDAVKWSPDETLLCAVGPYGLVLLYNTITWEILFKLEGHLNNVVDCAFNSDSALLATASSDTRVLLWSTVTGEIVKEYPHKIPIPLRIYAGGENGSFIRSLAISKNDDYLITACEDNKVRWFPLTIDRTSKMIFERTEINAMCVAVTSNEQTTAISTSDGHVRLLSSLITIASRQVKTLKFLSRKIINNQLGTRRKQSYQLGIPQHLIDFLMYEEIKMQPTKREKIKRRAE